MRKIFVVARREYSVAVRSKAFVISLVMMPLMMFGSMGVQLIMARQVDTVERRYAIVDRTPGEVVAPILEAALKIRNDKLRFDPNTKKALSPPFAIERIRPSESDPEAIQRQRLELSEKARNGTYGGLLEIGSDALSTPASIVSLALLAPTAQPEKLDDSKIIRYQTNRPADTDFRKWAEPVINLAIQQQRFQKTGISWIKVQTLLLNVPLVSKGMTSKDARTGLVADAPEHAMIAPIFVPLAFIFLMFMVVIVGSAPLVQSVVEEKMQRVAEVLLGSIKPFELMLGKLLGMTFVSLTVVVVYLSGAYYAAWRYGLSEYIPVSMIAWFIVYQTLAIFMFGSVFAAIGAACTDVKETQAMLLPVMMLIMLPMFALGPILKDPNGAFATGLSLFPFSTPMLMIARQSVPPGVPAWQPIVGITGVIITTIACVYVAGRIFRIGLLMQGKAPRLGELVKWIVRA